MQFSVPDEPSMNIPTSGKRNGSWKVNPNPLSVETSLHIETIRKPPKVLELQVDRIGYDSFQSLQIFSG